MAIESKNRDLPLKRSLFYAYYVVYVMLLTNICLFGVLYVIIGLKQDKIFLVLLLALLSGLNALIFIHFVYLLLKKRNRLTLL